MKNNVLSKLLLLLTFLLLLPGITQARDIEPIVSTDWLSAKPEKP